MYTGSLSSELDRQKIELIAAIITAGLSQLLLQQVYFSVMQTTTTAVPKHAGSPIVAARLNCLVTTVLMSEFSLSFRSMR